MSKAEVGRDNSEIHDECYLQEREEIQVSDTIMAFSHIKD